jgi:threonine dehydratase
MIESPLFKDVEAVVISIGGGGLMAGCASVFRVLRPDLKIYGVTAKNAPATWQSYQKKSAVEAPVLHTLADTIATKRTDPSMLEKLSHSVDDIFSISEESIAHAIALLAERSKLVVEGAGAITIAAILENLIPEKKIATILCGGNIDLPSFSQVLARGMVEQGRLVRLEITTLDRPGGLHAITKILAELGANILQVYHQRSSLQFAFGQTRIEVEIETKGKEHTEAVVEALRAKGFQVNKGQ